MGAHWPSTLYVRASELGLSTAIKRFLARDLGYHELFGCRQRAGILLGSVPVFTSVVL